MRCLPDSLDIVALTNADNFSRYDAEDMAVMREKGTKVLWQVDYAGRAAEFADAAKLGAWLDRVVSSVAANGMDGYSFTGIPNAGDPAAVQAAALIVSKLSADESKLLVFEGNPLFVAEADRAKVDYFILDTEKTEDVGDVKLQIPTPRVTRPFRLRNSCWRPRPERPSRTKTAWSMPLSRRCRAA